MYEQVFNFNARPFNSTPYVKHYFPATAMAQAVGQATICIQRGAGPVVAIGDIGTGKSLLLAKLATECQSEFQVVNIDCSQIQNGKELLQNILFQLGKPVNLDSETELRFAVIESANPTEESPEGILLLADDAETLTVDVLEAMRTLTNIVVEGSPRVRLVLAGRQPLEEQLADPSLASFSQRIASRVFLSNLSREDTSAYVVEHINRVGGDGQEMFPNETIVKLHDLTDGCPRLINQVCDFVLILAATRGETNVSASLIEESWNDVQSLPMASGRASTGLASSVAQTNENSDWTVIEFGQLDDDSPQPSNSTIYDFENSAATPETTSNDLLVGTESLDDATNEEALSEEPKQSIASEVDSDLGVDFAALQTMQDATITTDAVVATDAAEELATESTEATVQTSMEQELSAVFGTPVQSLGTAEATSDTADEPSESNPPLDDRSVKIDLANDASSIVGIAGIATTGIGSFTELASLTQQNSSVDDDSQPTTTELNDIDNGVEDHKQEGSAADTLMPEPQSNQVVQETETSDLDSSPTFPIVDSNSFTPATQPLQVSAESPSDVPGKPTTFGETSEQITASLTNESLNQNGEGATIEFIMDAPSDEVKTPVEDPFDESFQAEEVISDQIIKNSGLHNRNALKLSSADLSQLTPLHNPTADQPPQVVQESSSDPANVDTDTLETETPHAVNDSLVSDSVNDPLTAETDLSSLDSDAASIVGSASDQPLEDGADKGLSIVSEDSVFGADSTPEQSSDLHAEPTDSASPVVSEEQIATATSSDTSQSSETVQPRDNAGISGEISRQADEILARLQATSSELKQEQQILSDIREQQQIVNETQLSEEQSAASVRTPDEPKMRDDSEMLIVPPSPPPVEAKKEPEVFPLTDSPISSGRADRMDYEQLFERLRNQPDENKE